jgi:hypothetical protein
MLRLSKTVIFYLYTLLLIVNTNSKDTCPKYTCNTGVLNSCASVKVNSESNFVTLTDLCTQGQICDIPIPQWKTLTNADIDTNYLCKNHSIAPQSRYPGEECVKDTDCFISSPDTGRCTKDNVCSGVKEGGGCFRTVDCWKGLYCATNDSYPKCAKQLPVDSYCRSSDWCENNLLCAEFKCKVKPYSVDYWQYTSRDDPFVNHYCKLGYYDSGYRCSYLEQIPLKKGEFVKCKLGEQCEYTNMTGGKVQRDCECGYNADGQGYCPEGHNIGKYYY